MLIFYILKRANDSLVLLLVDFWGRVYSTTFVALEYFLFRRPGLDRRFLLYSLLLSIFVFIYFSSSSPILRISSCDNCFSFGAENFVLVIFLSGKLS